MRTESRAVPSAHCIRVSSTKVGTVQPTADRRPPTALRTKPTLHGSRRLDIVALLLLGMLANAAPCTSYGQENWPAARSSASADDESSGLFDKLKDQFKAWTGQGPDAREAQRLFSEGQRLYGQAFQQRTSQADEARETFLKAAELFDLAAERGPGSPVEEESLFLKGESLFFADHYPDAEDAFARLVKRYPRTRYLDVAQARRFAIAQYWLERYESDMSDFYDVNVLDESLPRADLFGHAMRVFDRIRLDDPTGKLADDATLAMGNAYFRRGKFLRADEYYTDLRKTFPNSEHQFRAHLLGLKAKLESYSGVQYSGKPLDEAELLVKQLRRQFPVEAEQEKPYLARAAAEIRYLKAEREWFRAERHYNRSEYGAAKVYYRELLKNYGDTPFAQRAIARMQQIGGEPDVPEQPLEWLVELFPEEDAVKPLIANQNDATRR